VRQLRNYIERCVALDNPNLPPNTDTKPPEQPAATDTVDISQPLKVARDQCVSNFERRYLEELLHEHNNNVTAAARAAEVDRIHFHRLLRKHGLRDYKPYKPGDGSEE
jgi:DNA-binding NtrC family response regulator